jgi:hypothetical protein
MPELITNKELKVDFEKIKSGIFLDCICISLLISLSPLKILGYGIPLILLCYVLIRLLSKALHKNLTTGILVIAGVLTFYLAKSYYLNYDFNLLGAVLSGLTYGSFFFVLVFPKFTVKSDAVETHRINRVLLIVFIFETAIALLQVGFFMLISSSSLDESAGDVVQGTINPFSFLGSSVGFNNQVFTINYIFILVYLIPFLLKTGKRYLIGLGVVVILLASVLHVLLSFVIAMSVCFALIGLIRFRKQLMRYIVIAIACVGVLFVTQPKNFSLFSFYLNMLGSGQSPKVFVIANSVFLLPEEYPDAVYLGLGPGQYTSRASLITTGKYFGDFANPTKLPFVGSSTASKAFNDYVFDIWEAYATNVEEYGNSTMSRPFFSILTIVMEFGIFAVLLLLFLVFRGINRIKKRCLLLFEEKEYEYAYFAFLSMTSILFVFFLAFFENYLESSASICSGLLLVRYFGSIKKAV